MDPAIKLQRHSELWQAGSTRVQRIAISGLIFASVIFFNVIEPFAQTGQSRKDLAGFEEQMRQAESEAGNLNRFAASLERISQAVDNAAWGQHKEKLVESFRSGAVTAPQAEADETIRLIAADVRSGVLDPLAAAVEEAKITGTLADPPVQMAGVIDRWEESHLGQRWFQTVEEKERTVVDLGATLESIQDETRQVLAELQQAVEAKRIETERARAKLENSIGELTARIQESLDEAIPAWARGLVSAEHMVSVYPWILIGIAIYLVGCALVTEKHYDGMANAAGWSQLERSDALLSSIWTLTWRGVAGTALCLANYFAVLVILAYFLNCSISLGGRSQPAAWPLNLVLALALLAVVATPLRRRKPH